MKSIKISVYLLLCLLQVPVFAQFDTEVSGVGTNAATFLEIGVGARAMAMGGAYASIANDPTALYYNPAGAVWVNSLQVEFMHNEWLVGTKYDFVAAVMPLQFINSALGFSFMTLDYGEQPVRTVERPEGTGENYGARDWAVGMTYSMALTDRFSFGITGKMIHQKIWNTSGSAAAMDLGIFYNTMVKGLRIGMSMTNFGTEIQLSGRDLDTTVDPDDENVNVDRVPVSYKTGAYALPLWFRVGISYERPLGPLGSAIVSMDVNHPSNSTESINLGFEYNMAGLLYLRAGYENMFEKNSINGMTFGAGVDYYVSGNMGFRFDYAYSDWSILENCQRFSVGVIF